MERANFKSIIEALLFINGEQLEIEKIAFAIDSSVDQTKELIRELMLDYKQEKRGIQIIEVNESFQMCTNPEYFSYIEKAFNVKPKKILSQALLETLAIIAYKQPITKMGVEEIRGVSAVHSINKLIEYNLVCEKGRLDAVGKPILFGTTDEFLKHFGFDNLKNLPDMPDNLVEESSKD